jgi:hypothetical protein
VDTLPKTAEGEIDRDQVKKDHGGKYWRSKKRVSNER